MTFSFSISRAFSRTVRSALALAASLAVVAVAPQAAAQEAETNRSPGTTRTIAFIAPIVGFAVNSPFGMRRLGHEARARMHEGLDFAAPAGTPVLAAAEGVVLRTGTQNGYGRFVEVEHANGVTSFYAHLSRIEVNPGDVLNAGEQLGRVGSTGRVTGPHLHFEIRRNGEQIDPQGFLGRTFEVETQVIPTPEVLADAGTTSPAAP